MRIKFALICISISIFTVLICIIIAVAAPREPRPSEDPVGFIAEHKGGEAPNYYIPETTENPDWRKYVGPDGYEYEGRYHGGFFTLGWFLEQLVTKEDVDRYTRGVFSHSFDFNERSFCRYFGITEDQYLGSISYYSTYKDYGDGGVYIVENYPRGIYGTNEDFIDVFVREEYRDSYYTDECIPDGDCPHTFTYHTISEELIDYVGKDAYAEFREQFYGTEEFNVLHFIEYFSLDRNDLTVAMASPHDPIPRYRIDYLFGDENMQREYFFIKSAQ